MKKYEKILLLTVVLLVLFMAYIFLTRGFTDQVGVLLYFVFGILLMGIGGASLYLFSRQEKVVLWIRRGLNGLMALWIAGAGVVLYTMPTLITGPGEVDPTATYFEHTKPAPVEKPTKILKWNGKPFFRPGEVCRMNLRELMSVGITESYKTMPHYKESNVTISLRKLGTDRFEVSGFYYNGRVTGYSPKNNEGILRMTRPADNMKRYENVELLLRFPNLETKKRMKPDLPYKITGKLQMQEGYVHVMTDKEEGVFDRPPVNAYYLVVESAEPVTLATSMISKSSIFPPYNPMQTSPRKEE